MRSPEQGAWLARLETEHDNLRTAVEWCRQRGEAAAGLRLTDAPWEFRYVRGHWTEGRQWPDHLAAAPHGATAAGCAKALIGAAALACLPGDDERARLLGATDALRGAIGYPLSPSARPPTAVGRPFPGVVMRITPPP